MDKEENKPEIDAGTMNILLAEDNQADIKISRRAFEKAKLKSNVYVVNNGEEALDFIYNKGKYQDKKLFPRPDLVILDIKMPRLDGFSVLDKIKDDLEYGSIPVIMLTSSKYEEDMIRSFKKGACAYISKPMENEEFARIIEGFDFFWHAIQKLNEGTRQKSQ